MTLLDKLLGLFGKDSNCNSIKDFQSQSKPKITTTSVNPLHSGLSPTSTGKFHVSVVGVTFHQEALQIICGNKREEGVPIYKQAIMIPENDNPEDPNAVRIDIGGETIGHLSRRKATVWRGKMISEKRSGEVMCLSQIVWDRGYIAEGSYGVLLDIDLSLPDSRIEPGSAGKISVSSEQPDHIEFFVNQLNRFELSHCKVGDPVGLWDVPGTKDIFIYRNGTGFGEGKIGICPEDVCKIIHKAPGCDAKIVSIYEGGCKISCRLISKSEMAERLKPFKAEEKKRRQDLKKDLITLVDYSTIDSGIYKCFISNQTGMCDAIGTWEQFKVIEERIAKLCQENNGKYFKTRAKTAIFAIIFAPNAKVFSNVTNLKNMGYKVTTFEKALEYFGLSDLWDCKKMAQHEYELKKFIYEDTFHKPFPLSKEIN
jgi:hypothetical protein